MEVAGLVVVDCAAIGPSAVYRRVAYLPCVVRRHRCCHGVYNPFVRQAVGTLRHREGTCNGHLVVFVGVEVIFEVGIAVHRYAGYAEGTEATVVENPERQSVAVPFVEVCHRSVDVHVVRLGGYVVPFEIGLRQVERIGICHPVVYACVGQQEVFAGLDGHVGAVAGHRVEGLYGHGLGHNVGVVVVFLGGGASMQFCMVPFNLLNKKASYLDTGTWASNAIKEAKLFGEVDVVASSKEANYTYIPKGYAVAEDSDYFHFTSNNTIYGTEMRYDPDLNVRLVSDMSSDIFSRPIDISKYDVIYAGAQKNLAPAGVTLAIVRTDALGHVDRAIPTMLNYNTHIKKDSMFNTPPVFPIFAALQTLKWYKELGGVAVIEKMNLEKAAILYDEIDRNKLFKGTAAVEDRSIMNVCFVMNDEYKELEDEFNKFASAAGMVGIKGHRSVGGFRASLYNAMPKSSVEALVATMKEFEKQH